MSQSHAPTPPPAVVSASSRVELASWRRRALASVIDAASLTLLPVALFVYALVTSDVTTNSLGQQDSTPSDTGTVAVLVALTYWVTFLLWNRVFRAGRTGQSIGKTIMGVRLLADGYRAPIGAARALGRELAHVLDAPAYVGYLWPIWDAKRQTFADKVVHTVVVRER